MQKNSMLVAPRTIASLTITLLVGAGANCGSGDGPSTTDRLEPGTSTAASQPLTATDLDAYERGMKKEIEAVRSARQQAASATDPQQRGRAIQAQWEDATVPQGAEAAALPVERYREVRGVVNEVFKTLDFQGKINGPLAIDMSRADAATKERLARDPLSDLSAQSAAALRARMDQLVPIWVEYVTLTAVAG